jgi:hypothetical protein
MRGGRVQRAFRRRWGEDLGEDEAQERIDRPTPSPVSDTERIHRSLKPLKVALACQSNIMRGTTSREVFGDRWGKTSEEWKPHERYRGETNPKRCRGELKASRG